MKKQSRVFSVNHSLSLPKEGTIVSKKENLDSRCYITSMGKNTYLVQLDEKIAMLKTNVIFEETITFSTEDLQPERTTNISYEGGEVQGKLESEKILPGYLKRVYITKAALFSEDSHVHLRQKTTVSFMLENEHPYLKILHEIAFQEPEQKISLKIFGHPTNMVDSRVAMRKIFQTILDSQEIQFNFSKEMEQNKFGRIKMRNGVPTLKIEGQKEIYRVISEKQPIKLKKGQIFKMGLLLFEVKFLKGENPIRRNELKNFVPRNGQCDFCKSSHNEKGDYLIQPCLCKGTSGKVHIKCLEEWAKKKIRFVIKNSVQMVDTNKFFCHACRQKFPKQFYVQDQFFTMLKECEKNTPYVQLEEKKSHYIIRVKLPEESKVTFGRNSLGNDFSVQNRYMSNHHCKFSRKGNEFELIDTNSSFGTLLKVEEAEKIVLKGVLQIGNFRVEVHEIQ